MSCASIVFVEDDDPDAYTVEANLFDVPVNNEEENNYFSDLDEYDELD